MNKIILLGYMGSGKSTIAKLLSKRINYSYSDLDKIIEQELNLTINEIFEQRGEIYFRKKEHQVLQQLLQCDENRIISLGGGTPCYANNMEMIHSQNCTSFYLKVSLDKLNKKLTKKKSKRPLIANLGEDEMKEFVAKHLFERSFFYNQATHTINTDGKSKDEIVAEIKQLLV